MNRDFKGIWIPREIWLAKDLSALEKSLWAEVHSLYDREKGGCYASNEYLCKFLDVKERRLRDMIANLKKKGWLVQVSFDGRTRIIKAIVPEESYEKDEGTTQENAGQTGSKMPGRGAVKCRSGGHYNAGPTYSIDTTLDKRIENPPAPQRGVEAAPLVTPSAPAAKAAPRASSSLSKKKLKKISDFRQEVLELGERFMETIRKTKPDFVGPKDRTSLLTSLEAMLDRDKRNPEKILEVLAWGLSDNQIQGTWNGWSSKIMTKNPAGYLRDKFDKIEQAMKARPVRRFAPSSTVESEKAMAEALVEGSI